MTVHSSHFSTRFNAHVPTCRKDALVDPHNPSVVPHGAVSGAPDEVTCRACRKATGLSVTYSQPTESVVESIAAAITKGTGRPVRVSKVGSSWVMR